MERWVSGKQSEGEKDSEKVRHKSERLKELQHGNAQTDCIQTVKQTDRSSVDQRDTFFLQ